MGAGGSLLFVAALLVCMPVGGEGISPGQIFVCASAVYFLQTR